MSNTKEKKPTHIVTGKVRFSYAKVFKAESFKGGEPKYSVACLIPKSDKETVSKINAAIKAATEEGMVEKFGGKLPKKGLDLPLRDGDEKDGDENYKGHWYINAKSTNKPTILDRDKQEILDPADFYSGCYGRASINFYAFNVSGNMGVAAGLNNLQKLSDGPALSGGTRAEDDFADDFDGDNDIM